MLVIRRHSGQAIVIGDDIEIQVIEVAPNRVKLGIVAPSSVPVLRKEVWLTRTQNLNAARPAPAEMIASLLDQFRK